MVLYTWFLLCGKPHELLQAPFPVRSAESPLSATSLKNCHAKASLDHQASVFRIEESLSPASIDSVVVAESGIIKNEKYVNPSPINSLECVEADQVRRYCHLCSNFALLDGLSKVMNEASRQVGFSWCLLILIREFI